MTTYRYMLIAIIALVSHSVHAIASRDGADIRATLHLQQPGIHAMLTRAESAYELGDFKKVIEYSTRALRDIDENQDTENAVRAYNILGAACVKTADFDKGSDMLQRAYGLVNSKLAADHPLAGDTHFHLGVYYDRIGHGEKSLNHLQSALHIRRLSESRKTSVAEVYSALGELHLYTLQEFRTAGEWFNKAIESLELSGAPDDLRLYYPYFCLAEANRRIGDLDNALGYAFKALAVIKSRPEYNRYLERCYALLGDIHYSRADFPGAIENYRAAIAENIRLDGPYGYYLIRKYTNLGVALGESGDTEQAIVFLKKSLDLSQKHHLPNAELRSENYLHLGRMFQKKDMADSAEFFLKRYLQEQRREGGLTGTKTSEAYRYLARFFQSRGEYDTAFSYVQNGIAALLQDAATSPRVPDFERVKDRPGSFEVFRDKGSILLDKYRNENADLSFLTGALECFQLADTLMQASRNAYRQEGSKLFFADHYHDIYENALSATYLLFEKTKKQEYIEIALAFMERSKALLLAEALNKAQIFSRVGLPDSLREMEARLNRTLALYRSQIEEAGHGHHHDHGETIQQIQSKIFDVAQEQSRLLDTIARRYPGYFGVKYQTLSSPGEIRAHLRKKDAALVEYFWGKDRVFRVVLSAEGMDFHATADVKELESGIRRYYESLQTPSWRENDSSFENFVRNAHAVYAMLMSPVKEIQAENLIIVRDGPLLLIPFESLLVSNENTTDQDYGNLDYLIRHQAISYAHSADILLKDMTRSIPPARDRNVLAFAYAQSDAAIQTPVNSAAMNDLPGAAREISAISEILPGTFLLGDDATEQKFKALAGDYDILHLAVHGKSDPEKQFSGSLFFRPSGEHGDDGELHVYELYDLNLKARLAVLSACESGVGKIFRGEGAFSIARGFAYAGCPSTVMTLWPVSDAASARIMNEFYNGLNDGKPIDAALRTAKLKYIESVESRLSHPAFWAAYLPTGNMDPVISRSVHTGLAWIMSAGLLTALTFFVLRKVRANIKDK